MGHIELSSYKYLKPAMDEERRMIRRARNARAIRDFNTFLFGLIAMQAGIFLVRTMDHWLPHVMRVLSAMGIA